MGPDVDQLRVVAGAIVRRGRVLVALRSPTMSQPDCWELPGGRVEPGESDRGALARELREELGVTVAVGPFLGESRTTSGTRAIHLLAYRCELLHGEPTALEHAALAWAGPEDLDAFAWAPADVPLVGALAADLRRDSV